MTDATMHLLIDAAIVILIVVATTILTLLGHLTSDATTGLYGSALGYAGGVARTAVTNGSTGGH